MQQSPAHLQVQRTTEGTSTVTEVVAQNDNGQRAPTNQNSDRLVLRLESPDTRPRVQWTVETVDNEQMGKKKSKCCCIYKKKRNWDESDSSDEDCESEHCRGHVEKHRKSPKDDGDGGPGPSISA